MINEPVKGRGAAFNPPNRFEQFHVEPVDIGWDDRDQASSVRTEFFRDTSRSILARNDSPDIPFTFSINPYRGCEHGCIYCYARPSHEYLGFSSGLDFETRILVKTDAPALLEKEFRKKSWEPQLIAFSGNTDCYQPAERKLMLTRKCLEVCAGYRNPVGIITKNSLVTRDIDILKQLAAVDCVSVTVSVTTLNQTLASAMEPRTSAPYRRLETIEALAKEGIPVTALVAPIIPGLTDEEMPAILRAASERGARWAGYTLLRLPGSVEQLFINWLEREMPDRARKILNRLRDAHGGRLGDSRWGKRMRGDGEYAAAVRKLFSVTCAKYRMNTERSELSTRHFRRDGGRQTDMFE